MPNQLRGTRGERQDSNSAEGASPQGTCGAVLQVWWCGVVLCLVWCDSKCGLGGVCAVLMPDAANVSCAF